jgi:3-dehydroquinate synthetase
MLFDKKTRAGRLRFVLSSRIGEAHSSEAVPTDTLENVLRLMPKFLDRKAELSATGELHG